MPWIGGLRRARVFLLSLNPGLGAHDYFGEHRVAEYRKALEANLAQDGPGSFPFLDPMHAWHGGANYWKRRLTPIVAAIGGPRAKAMSLCAQSVAVLELVPYHSESFGLGDAQLDRLESVRLIRDFVHSGLLARQARGECLVIALRSANRWKIPGVEERGITRSATISELTVRRIASAITQDPHRCQ